MCFDLHLQMQFWTDSNVYSGVLKCYLKSRLFMDLNAKKEYLSYDVDKKLHTYYFFVTNSKL
jgi:hypothetical protein